MHIEKATLYFPVEIWPLSSGFFYKMTNMTAEIKNRVTFYIDGFNFYYGIRRARKSDTVWGNFYWIDMVKLCESFLGDGQELVKVVYFTASPMTPAKNSRQSAFLNANKLLNGNRFEVIRGKYMDKPFECPNCAYTIHKPEEKKTDVNISVRMIEDCITDSTDSLSLVSADTDLIPPLEVIRRNFPDKKIKVYFPPSNFSRDINDYMLTNINSKPKLLIKNQRRFSEAIMPDAVSKDGTTFTIPQKWKDRRVV